jgi:hypothetical protein
MWESHVRENRAHGWMRRRELRHQDQLTMPRGPRKASRRPYDPATMRPLLLILESPEAVVREHRRAVAEAIACS